MLTFVLILVGLVIAGAIGLRFWRRWIEPWKEIDELVRSIVERKTPRKFLTTANPQANAIGLGLEKFAAKQRELERLAAEGTVGLQNILGSLPDGIAVVDQQRRIQLMNPRFRELFAVAEGEGASVLEIVRDAMVDRALASALEGGDLRSETMAIARGTGTEARRELEVTAVPFQSGHNTTRGAVVLFRDITHVRQVEEMRRDFVANVSHELRTPLSIFRGYLETLLDDPKQPTGELVRILEVMERHSERLTTLVDDVLSLARLEAPESHLDLQEISLRPLLTEILHDWEKRFSAKQLRAELDVSADLPPLLVDEGRVQEVIYNLLDNAVKYSQPGGQIGVRAEPVDDQVRVSVSDQGVGIPARELPRIFERFYRADKARSRELGGTGLGLSIVKHIAQLHGGSVEAASEVGHGTTISFLLPLAPVSRSASVTES